MNKKRKKNRGNRKSPGNGDIKSAFDALIAVQALQTQKNPNLKETQTASRPEKIRKSVGSDVLHDELTGAGLQWYEKLQDEKLSNVETRLGAQTKELIMTTKSYLERKILELRDSYIKYLVTTVLGVIVAFVIFYLSAFDSMKNGVTAFIKDDLESIEKNVVIIDEKIDGVINKVDSHVNLEKHTSENVQESASNSKGLTKQSTRIK